MIVKSIKLPKTLFVGKMKQLAVALAITSFVITPNDVRADPCEAPLPDKGASFSGTVTYIVDGDGLCVGEEQGGIEVRLSDFNAPELRTDEGKVAKTALENIAEGKWVDCIALGKSYDRSVAQCSLQGRRLGVLMREAGIEEGGR